MSRQHDIRRWRTEAERTAKLKKLRKLGPAARKPDWMTDATYERLVDLRETL